MRITQAHISDSISIFKDAYLSKFDLINSFYIYEPVVFIGMYSDDDYAVFQRYIADKVVLWCGTDALMITPQRAAILKNNKATHIVKSQFMSDDLKKFGIPHKIIPVSWQDHNINPVPLGDSIFHYGDGDFYGTHLLHEIAKKTGLHIYRANKDSYNKEDLHEVYRDCFIGLRLTKHDGLPNTVLELGMMGRRSIYNGGIPTSIRWDDMSGLIGNIMTEYSYRKIADYKLVSKQIKQFINIGESWLEV